MELHLENLRKSLKTNVEVKEGEAATVNDNLVAKTSPLQHVETVKVKAGRKTDVERKLEENDLDAKRTGKDEEGLTNDCNDDDDYGYDEQEFEEVLSV